MSNRVIIETKTFTNKDNDKSFGFTISDCYGQGFCDYWDSIPDDDLEILQLVTECTDQSVVDLVLSLSESEKGCLINDTFYDYDEIKHILEG